MVVQQGVSEDGGVVWPKDERRSQADRVWSASAHVESISPQPSLHEVAVAAVEGEVGAIAADGVKGASLLADPLELNLEEAGSVAKLVEEVLAGDGLPGVAVGGQRRVQLLQPAARQGLANTTSSTDKFIYQIMQPVRYLRYCDKCRASQPLSSGVNRLPNAKVPSAANSS